MKSERAPPNVSKLPLFLLSHRKISIKQSISKNVLCMCLWPRLKFSKRRSNISRARPWYQMKYQKEYTCEIWKPYHLPIKSYHQGLEFWKKVKLQGQRSEGQGNGIKWKVLPEGIQMCNMKTLSPTNQTLWSSLTFLKRSNSKVKGQRVKVMISDKRSYQKEYTCAKWKPYYLPINMIKSYDQG
jgi:hypothetical protein